MSNLSFPLYLILNNNEYSLKEIDPKSSEFNNILEKVKKAENFSLRFFSSQAEYVFERIHLLFNAKIKNIAPKIDPILREIIKNAEKENASAIARFANLCPNDKSKVVPLNILKNILNEKEISPISGKPLIFDYPEYYVDIIVKEENNELVVEVGNFGVITEELINKISNRIRLGITIAQFDLVQEFEQKQFLEVKDKIKNMFLFEFREDLFENLWSKAFDESFDEYWMASPYFLLLMGGTHSSFFPYFSAAFAPLNIALKKMNNPDQEHFTAGLGYVQSSFIIESNRSIYGTYGQLLPPFVRGNRTYASFKLGLSHIKIDI